MIELEQAIPLLRHQISIDDRVIRFQSVGHLVDFKAKPVLVSGELLFQGLQTSRLVEVKYDGLVIRVLNEPTAAAFAYGLDKDKKERKILVFDLGGGTFDVSLLSVEDSVFEVMAVNGDTHLGGEDFDNRIIKFLVKSINKKLKKDVGSDLKIRAKLKREAEKAKRALTSQMSVRIEFENLVDGQDFTETLTRAKFEELNMDLFKKTLAPVEKVLKDGKLSKSEVVDIVLVSCSTLIPKVVDLLEEFFNGKKASKGINPDVAVAYGAAVQAFILTGGKADATSDMVILDVCTLTLGSETMGGVMTKLIACNNPIPTRKSRIFSTAADNQPIPLLQHQISIDDRVITFQSVEHLVDFKAIPALVSGELLFRLLNQIGVTFSMRTRFSEVDSLLTMFGAKKMARLDAEILRVSFQLAFS